MTRSGLWALLLFSTLTNAFVAVQPTRLGSLTVRKQAVCSPDDIGLVIEHATRGVFVGFIASQFIWATGSFLSLLLVTHAKDGQAQSTRPNHSQTPTGPLWPSGAENQKQ